MNWFLERLLLFNTHINVEMAILMFVIVVILLLILILTIIKKAKK